MGTKESKNHINDFNPDVTLLEDVHRDFSVQLDLFDAGTGYENFNDFIKEDAFQYNQDGDGVTYVVWNVFVDESGEEYKREVVAFYTLASTAIPYEDRIRKEENEIGEDGELYDTKVCGISAVEIKMFAVDKRYQDLFFVYEGEDLPIAAWIIRSIVHQMNQYITGVLGFKALFLHSLPDAEEFYQKNQFNIMKVNMHPLHNVDSEFKPMYLTLRDVYMNYDD